jgi:hypothetical protein
MSKTTENSSKETEASAKLATARRKGGDRVPESAENFEHTIRRVVIEKARLRDQQR